MAKIISAETMRRWDEYTIKNKPISSLDLMESAAEACVNRLDDLLGYGEGVSVFCGPGNNGGDGLAIARLLQEANFEVTVYLITAAGGSADYETNLRRFMKKGKIIQLNEDAPLPEITDNVIIDAMFGIGLNKPITGYYAKLIRHINEYKDHILVFSIDIPSGMYADKSSGRQPIVYATITFTFGLEKPAFFMPENAAFTGEVLTLDIGLLPEFMYGEDVDYETTDQYMAFSIRKPRNKFSDKNNFGHACIVAGSYGMMGAAALSVMGCLRSGVGKLTCCTCQKGYDIMQVRAPEAMCKVSGKTYITDIENPDHYTAIGVGPGIGRHADHVKILEKIFAAGRPVVIDADALNVLSDNKQLYGKIPPMSILTPHHKEFERLFGKTGNDFEERDLAVKMAAKYDIIIVLKGRYTCIASPHKHTYINETGNPGMATGGSGDVLTGILTGLLAQGYDPVDVCILGVYLHGLAGDLAAEKISQESLIASDICKYLGKAFRAIDKW